MQLDPVGPSTVEVLYAVAGVVAFAFAGFAIWKMATRQWSVRHGLGLILLTFVVPLSGPVIVGLSALWRRPMIGPSRRTR